ncbi:MAG TPA: cupredoxin family copper-binding protein [Gemmatimonadales bacterium]|jgi:plastocyanin|nr:cupredoxin family copper-binding protein [Gemmatimonadales bacterium]
MGLFRSIAAGLGTIAVLSNAAAAQSVLDRSPNLSGGWVGEPGTLQFNFVHRFSVSDPPTRKVSNSPTFLLGYRLPFPLLVGVTYATSSDVAPAFPNEWELFGRYAPLAADRGSPLDAAVQLGYNQATESVDGEVTLARRAGRLRLFAVGRVLSNGYASDTARYAVGGGATLHLTRHVALAGDVATLLDRRPGEKAAWGAALQLAIPYSPHTFSLQVTNTNTGTLQGASRGIDNVRGGFEFTIPFTLSRYFGRRAAAGTARSGTAQEMRQMAFVPQRLEVSAGATVEWTNRDQLAHTITADDGTWDSGLIDPGKTWRRTFDQPGTYTFHCTPHPFMTGVIVVR